MTKTLIDRIREAGELNLNEDRILYESSPAFIKCFIDGAKHQHAQSAWQREALLIAVEALKLSPSGCNNAGQYGVLKIYPGQCAKSKHACAPCLQKQKLTEIAALVPKGEK